MQNNMCGIIGARIFPTPENLTALRNLFIESQIRGKHATGFSYVQNGKVHTIIQPVPAVQANLDFEKCVNEDGMLYLIGHTRYSTSDLAFNQPIASADISIVHNGVITQELFEKWGELYGEANFKTRNDTELLLKTIEAHRNPWERWYNSSIAMITLDKNKKFNWGRNGKRPLWTQDFTNEFWACSTQDIARRAGLLNLVREESKTDYDTQP